MIVSFRHKGLERLFEGGDRKGLPQDMILRIRNILAAIDGAAAIEEIDLLTFRLHRLKGDLKGQWAVTVRANWRIVFRFDNGSAYDLDFVDYH
jgi:proteic killer suppression protein